MPKRKPMDLDLKEGALRKAIGVPEGENVKISDKNKIINAEEGAKVKMSTGKTVTATPLLKKRANLAKTMETKWNKGRKK